MTDNNSQLPQIPPFGESEPGPGLEEHDTSLKLEEHEHEHVNEHEIPVPPLPLPGTETAPLDVAMESALDTAIIDSKEQDDIITSIIQNTTDAETASASAGTTTIKTDTNAKFGEATAPVITTPSSGNGNSTKQQARMDSIWNRHLTELKTYREEKGNVSVPRKSGQLGEWCRTQRRYYKALRRGEVVPLTRERKKALDELGFVWFPGEERKKRKIQNISDSSNNAATAAASTSTANANANATNGVVTTSNLGGGIPGIDPGAGVGGSIGVTVVGGNSITTTNVTKMDVDPQHQGGSNVSTSSNNSTNTNMIQHNLCLPGGQQAQVVNTGASANASTTTGGLRTSTNPMGIQLKQSDFETLVLFQAHKGYEDAVRTIRSANEKLCDAQNFLEAAQRDYEEAKEAKEMADEELSKASNKVLQQELDDNQEDEWVMMYQKIVKHKENHGEILFAKLYDPRGGKSQKNAKEDQDTVLDASPSTSPSKDAAETATATATATEGADDGDEGDKDTPTKTGEDADADTSLKDEAKNPTDNAISTFTSMKTDEQEGNAGAKSPSKKTESSPPPSPSTSPGGASTETGNDTEMADASSATSATASSSQGDPELATWVNKIRKNPKKQFNDWRRQALDNIGFLWCNYDAVWTARYRELEKYKDENGHTLVPTSFPVMGVWVGTQRKQYRLLQRGKASHMTNARVEMLNKIDFIWEVNTWIDRFQEIKAFKEQEGHLLVPTEYHNKQLRPWISTQRSHYRFQQEGKPSQLTQERIDLLNSIDFPWKTKEDWQTRYSELLDFHKANGHVNVPRVYEKSQKLYRWVNCQRMEYQKFVANQPCRLKADQGKLLSDIGFDQASI